MSVPVCMMVCAIYVMVHAIVQVIITFVPA